MRLAFPAIFAAQALSRGRAFGDDGWACRPRRIAVVQSDTIPNPKGCFDHSPG